VALGIDWEEWPEVLGTIAGDDTILLILREAEELETIKARIRRVAGDAE
jgi:transcriptional regulator of arginine metabolism